MKNLVLALAAAGLVVLLVPAAGCSDKSAEETCDRFKSLCNTTAPTDGGPSITVTATCDADKLDDISNADEVKDCVADAKDCNSATACMLKAKP